jgi:1-deoxy-D-xylulose-5-phosphate synthase
MGSLIEQFVAATPEAPFSEDQFPKLAAEVRDRILETVSQNGGHLASNLGVVELTIALLATFRPETDRIVWDVGHQGYAWKLLTGRADKFGTLRQHGGISGFLKRHESPCDAFDAGHAGTAISAALGIAAARDRAGRDEHVVAVVGDASFSNGISLEALNNAVATTRRFIVILNDNEMSISQNVGALSRYFGRLLSSNRYNRVKKAIESAAKKLRLDPLRGTYYKVEHALKGLFVRNGFVESFGLRYVGPIDGHDFKSLLSALAIARDSDRPILLHIGTTKGKGYAPAETEPDKWHGVSPFDRDTGKPKPSSPGFSSALGEALSRLADDDKRVIAITAAMKSGTGLDAFAAAHPDRFFDVGICEEHAATFAGGLAAAGMHPFVALYSTFAQRAVDSVFHDICLQNLPVTFCLDRAGVVGADGPTHHGLYDIPLLRSFPNITMLQPRDEAMLGKMLRAALALPSPCVIRYPRGKGVAIAGATANDNAPFEIGKAEIVRKPVRDKANIWIWALGDMIASATEAADILEKEGLSVGIVDPRSIKPLDTVLLLLQARSGARIVTIEDGCAIGGFGTAVLETLSSEHLPGALILGFPDAIVGQGTQKELLSDYGLDGTSIAAKIKTF